MRLRDYQLNNVLRGVDFMKAQKAVYLADEMGLGKTAQAIEICKRLNQRNLLILCPASVVFNWVNELELWNPASPEPQTILSSKQKICRGWPMVVIISYDLAKREAPMRKLLKYRWDAVIYDEAHYLKGRTTARTKAMKILNSQSDYQLYLSGTPAPNSVVDLYPVFHEIMPKKFPDFWAFAKRYTNAKKNYWGGWEFKGHRNTTELKAIIRNNFFLRNRKSEVLSELPAKVFVTVPIRLGDDVREYSLAPNELRLIEEAIQNGRLPLLSEHIASQRMGLGLAKVPGVYAHIKTLISAKNRLVVFAYHTAVIKALGDLLNEGKYKVACITGSTPKNTRQRIIDDFQDVEVEEEEELEPMILLAQVVAAGVGVNLTAADTCLFAEYSWVPAEMAQACDRLHRIGQKKSVTINYMVAEESMDEYLLNSLNNKMTSISEVVE